MSLLRNLAIGLRSLFRKNQVDRELDEELGAYLEMEAAEKMKQGMSRMEALRAVRLERGSVEVSKEVVRSGGWETFVETCWRDLCFAVRMLRKSPGFSAAAIVSLALGIGANTTIFSLINALLLRSLPVSDPAGILQVQLVEQGRTGGAFGYPTVKALADRTDIFSWLSSVGNGAFDVTSPQGIERVTGAWVTGDYYPMLGLRAFAGRLLAPYDDQLGAPPVTVLSYRYWQRRFGGDFGVIGQSLQIEGNAVQIVGIGPPGFSGTTVGEEESITLPLGALPQIMPGRATQLGIGPQWLRVFARLRPGVSMTQAAARLAVVWPQLASTMTTPQMNAMRRESLLKSTLDISAGGTGWSSLRAQFRRPLIVLLWVTILVLLVTCANFASLLLARGTARSREVVLRLAIGANRSRVIFQLITESVTLSLIGAGFAVGLAGIGSRLLLVLLSTGRRDPVRLDLTPDAHVLLFAVAVAIITGIVFGGLPALSTTGLGAGSAIGGTSTLKSHRGSRIISAVVVAQVALSIILLIGAGLFVHTLQNLQQVNTGFRTQGVLVVTMDARVAGYMDTRLQRAYEDLLQRFRQVPNVVSAGLSSDTPLSGGIRTGPISVAGQPPSGESVHFNNITPGYFTTLGAAILQGRDFGELDRVDAARVAIVSEAFVRRHFPEQPPIGQQIAMDNAPDVPIEIVGVVKDIVTQNLREPPAPAVYLPYFQYPERIGFVSFAVRVNGSLLQAESHLRDVLRA